MKTLTIIFVLKNSHGSIKMTEQGWWYLIITTFYITYHIPIPKKCKLGCWYVWNVFLFSERCLQHVGCGGMIDPPFRPLRNVFGAKGDFLNCVEVSGDWPVEKISYRWDTKWYIRLRVETVKKFGWIIIHISSRFIKSNQNYTQIHVWWIMIKYYF